ncbi:MAG: carbohydrate ABC transporter permease [Acidimicrobiales bacterium]
MDRPRRIGWLLALPAFGLFLLFMLYPILYNIFRSFGSQQGALHNYSALAARPAFASSVFNTLKWVAVSCVFEIVIGFVLAVLIEFYIVRGRGIYRAVLFLPMVVTPTVIALVFTTLYAPDYGALYGVARAVGLGSHFPALLSNPSTVTYALIAINIWQWLGWFVLLYSVAMSQINSELLDAAAIDGAGGIRLWKDVLVPLVRPTTLTLLIFGIIEALQQFAIVYIATNGGPGNSSQVMGSYVYKLAFVDNRVSLSASLATLLFGMSFLMVGIVFVLAKGRFTVATGG